MTTLAKYTYLGLGTVVQVDYTEPDVRYDLVTGGSSTNPYGGLDRFGRVTDLLWQKYSGTPTDLVRLGYGYDRVSNRTYREDQVAPSGFDELYAYDGIHRLKDFDRGDLNANEDAITSPTLEQSWGLDATGNWSAFQQNVPGTSSQDLTQSRTHNKVNEITNITETVGTSWVTPQHDRNGNMTFMPQPEQPTEGFTATYDAWNRLVKLEETVEPGSSSSSSSSKSSSSSSSSSESGSLSSSSSESQSSSSSSDEPLVVTYAYDGQNWRTEKDVNGETTHFYYSHEWQCLEEREGTSSDAHDQYLWGLRYIDNLVLRDRDTTGNGTLDERLYAMQDDNWNVVAVADTSAVLERYIYDAYGPYSLFSSAFDPSTTSAYGWKYLYAGQRLVAQNSLYSLRTRYLHARIGRFLTRDPVRYFAREFSYPLNANLYNYVRNLPTTFVDPFGLQPANPKFKADLDGKPIYIRVPGSGTRKLLGRVIRPPYTGVITAFIDADFYFVRPSGTRVSRTGFMSLEFKLDNAVGRCPCHWLQFIKSYHLRRDGTKVDKFIETRAGTAKLNEWHLDTIPRAFVGEGKEFGIYYDSNAVSNRTDQAISIFDRPDIGRAGVTLSEGLIEGGSDVESYLVCEKKILYVVLWQARFYPGGEGTGIFGYPAHNVSGERTSKLRDELNTPHFRGKYVDKDGTLSQETYPNPWHEGD